MKRISAMVIEIGRQDGNESERIVSVRLCIGVIDEDRAVDTGRGVKDGGVGGLSKDYNNIVDPGY